MRFPGGKRYAHKFMEEEVRKSSWLFYVWGHSYELEADDSWEQLIRGHAYPNLRLY